MNAAGLTLYHGLASTCSKKVRLCLYEKRLTFESRLLDLQRFEQHEPQYLALNPNGVVPTLVHDGRPVIESSVIIEYIDDTFPEVPLTPLDSYDRAKMRLWLKYSDDAAYNAVYVPTWHHMRSRAREGLSPGELDKTLSHVPSKERRDRWKQMAAGGFSDEELQEAYAKMESCLTRIEEGLASSDWLAGERYSLADIAIVPFIDRISNLRPDFLETNAYPRLLDWYERMRNRPAFDKAFDFKDDPRAKDLPNL